MVNKKPSTTKKTERTNLINRFNGYLNSFSTNKKAVEKAINKLGIDESHWDAKYNVLPFTKDKGWENYLGEDFEMGGKDDKTAEKNADDELQVRMDGVSDVFCRAVVNYYSDAIKYETSLTTTQTFWGRLENYVDDTANHNVVEKDFLGNDPLKKLIADARTKGTGTTPHTTTGTDYAWDKAPIGLCQRWGGNPDDTIGGKKVLVGFSMRFLGTEK